MSDKQLLIDEIVAAAIEQVDKLPQWCTHRLYIAVRAYQEPYVQPDKEEGSGYD